MSELHNPKIAILASGSGSTAEAYAQAVHDGRVRHEIGLVITNNPEAGILDRVERWNREWGFDVETAAINNVTHPKGPQGRGQSYEAAEAICQLADRRRVDLIAALGYMTIINEPLVSDYGFVPGRHTSKYQARMVNTHPGPLPLTADTYGKGPAKKVLEAYKRGEIEKSQNTVHVVAPGVDEGPAAVPPHDVPILPDDTPESLFERTQWIEKATIAYALDKFLREQHANMGQTVRRALGIDGF